MTKQERGSNDFFPTPSKAVTPLIPFLPDHCRFAEPCAGQGHLVWLLEQWGHQCIYAGDLHSGQDALTMETYGASRKYGPHLAPHANP